MWLILCMLSIYVDDVKVIEVVVGVMFLEGGYVVHVFVVVR